MMTDVNEKPDLVVGAEAGRQAFRGPAAGDLDLASALGALHGQGQLGHRAAVHPPAPAQANPVAGHGLFVDHVVTHPVFADHFQVRQVAVHRGSGDQAADHFDDIRLSIYGGFQWSMCSIRINT